MARRDRYLDIKSKILTESPLIIDAGANDGSTVQLFLAQYNSPKIYAFEPIPDCVNRLMAKFKEKDNVHIIPKALGADTKKVSFNVTNNEVSSSILSRQQLKKNTMVII